jgi:hypothetical protein
MEAFEEWLKPRRSINVYYDTRAAEAWKAALEWGYDLYMKKGNNPKLFEELLTKEIYDG